MPPTSSNPVYCTDMGALTQARLKELLTYDPDTGLFRWNVSRGSVRANSVAGTLNGGYMRVRIDKEFRYLHRLAFLYIGGALPAEHVDHINGVRDDNRWGNLRSASLAENNRNSGTRATNTSGLKGVSRNGSGWLGQIVAHGTHHYLGTFRTKKEAAAAVAAAREQHHGEFANHGAPA